LKIIKLNKSTYYYAIGHRGHVKVENGGRPIPGYSYDKKGNQICDEQIKEWICEIVAGDGFAYGYIKITKELEREYKLVINKKKVYRLCKELKLLKPQRKLKTRHPKKLSRNREITGPNQLWEADIKYAYATVENRFFFVLSYIDVYDKNIVDYYIGLHCEGTDAVQTLQRGLLKRQLFNSENKPVIRTDNGSQFISKVFGDKCEEFGVEHERIPCKTPNKNAHIESFHRIMEDECTGIEEFETYGQGYSSVVEFMERYNNRRIHSSIGYRTPKEFYVACEKGLANGKVVRV